MTPPRRSSRARLWRAHALGAALLAALLAVAAHAQDRRASARGAVVRVAVPPTDALDIPSGPFSMGLDPDSIELLREHCKDILGGYAEACGRLAGQYQLMGMRTVFVSRFAIGRREVTVDEYRACVEAGRCGLDPLVVSPPHLLRDDFPIVNVTWWEAAEYCRFRGGRLPTEAEWERAARGDDTRRWPWGDQARPDDFNHGKISAPMMRTSQVIKARSGGAFLTDLLGDSDDSDGAAQLAAVGSYVWGAGPWGTLDQAGNAAEWVYDGWSESGYDGLPSSNPAREPALFAARVVRGGSWIHTPQMSRVDARDIFNSDYIPDTRSFYIGFRCAWDRR